jgi:hypothetical protein
MGRLLAAAAAVGAMPVSAQQTPAPAPAPTPTPRPNILTLPGVERFTLPAQGPQSTRPTPSPTPAPVPAPTPTPTAAPARAPAPRPTPAVVAAPRPAPSSAPVPAAAPTPAAPLPVASATPQSVATSTPTPAPVQQPVAEPAPVWPWVALGAGGMLALGALGWLFLRPRRRPVEREAPRPAPVPAAAAPSPPPPPAPVPAPPPPRPVPAPGSEPFAVEIRPRALIISESEAAFEFELVVANPTAASAEGIRVSVAMISANPMQDAYAGAFHANPTAQPSSEPFDLLPGKAWGVAGRLQIAREQIHVVEVGGRAMFVPLVMVDLRWRGGLSIRRHGADFMIGVGGQGDKLGPIWLDRRLHQNLAANRYIPRPLAEVAAEAQRA